MKVRQWWCILIITRACPPPFYCFFCSCSLRCVTNFTTISTQHVNIVVLRGLHHQIFPLSLHENSNVIPFSKSTWKEISKYGFNFLSFRKGIKIKLKIYFSHFLTKGPIGPITPSNKYYILLLTGVWSNLNTWNKQAFQEY